MAARQVRGESDVASLCFLLCSEVAYRVAFSQDTLGLVDRRAIVEEPGTVPCRKPLQDPSLSFAPEANKP